MTTSGADHGKKPEQTRGASRAPIGLDSRLQTLALAEFSAASTALELAGAPNPAEVGDVLVGHAPGRVSDLDITLAKLAGISAIDLAAAEAALQHLAPELLR
jgi:ornithine cyclodeaminase/alanine dehydrogenase-like protein (mu-crystallin family)